MLEKNKEIINLEQIDLSVPGRTLLHDVHFKINTTDKIGIVGRNGAGKSHLLKLLSGVLQPDTGTVKVAYGMKILLIKQEMPDGNQTPQEYVLATDRTLTELYEQTESLEPDKADAIFMEIDEIEQFYKANSSKVLQGLGLTQEQILQPMNQLSGGLQMRINIASALLQCPDLLLLDEPTNYLDLEATFWLMNYLLGYNKAFVLVSHDVKLLNLVTSKTLHLKQGELIQFNGSYDSYRKQAAAAEMNAIQTNRDLAKQAKRDDEIYLKFRGIPSRAAQATQRKKNASNLREQIVEIVPEEPVIPLDFGQPQVLSNPLADISEVVLCYSKNKPILKIPQLTINGNDKIGLIGRNGQGKSTLIRNLVGDHQPGCGHIIIRNHCKIGYFSQDLLESLNVKNTVLEQFSAKTSISLQDARTVLGNYGFAQKKSETLVGNLSGGELSRLALAIICASNSQLIILDEPTNHLDVETREMLVGAIQKFKGAVLLVSHDADLHQQCMKTFWLADKGTVKPYKNDLSHYFQAVGKSLETQPASEINKNPKKEPVLVATNRHAFHQPNNAAQASKQKPEQYSTSVASRQ